MQRCYIASLEAGIYVVKLHCTKKPCVAALFAPQFSRQYVFGSFLSILLLWWKLAQSQWIALFFRPREGSGLGVPRPRFRGAKIRIGHFDFFFSRLSSCEVIPFKQTVTRKKL